MNRRASSGGSPKRFSSSSASSVTSESLEPDARHEAALIGAEQIARATQLHVERRELEAGAELAVALERLET